MSGLFDAIKGDLLDRRMRIVVIVVAVALVGGLAYAALGGSSPSATPVASTEASAGGAGSAPTISQASHANPRAAAAETTYGASQQHNAHLKDPFTTLPSAQPKAPTITNTASKSGSSSSGGAAAKGGGSSSASGSGSGGSSSSGGSGSSGSSTPPKPKTHTEFHVSVELGPVPSVPGEAAKLTPFTGVKQGQSLPSKSHPLVVFKSASLATSGAKEGSGSAVFALVSSPIVNGPGACLPSDTQCESVKLTNGQTEELQYVEANGQTVAYLLRVTGIFKKTVTTG